MAYVQQVFVKGNQRKQVGMTKKSAVSAAALEREGWKLDGYLVGWREPVTGDRKSRRVATKKEADSLAREMEREIERGEYVPVADRKVPLGDFMELLVESDKTLRVSTQKSYRITLGHLTEAGLASRPMGSITAQDIRRFYMAWTGGLHTLEKMHTHLVKTFRSAVAEGKIARSPMDTITTPTAPTVKPIEIGDLPTLDQVMATANAATPRYRAAILVAAFAGLRGGEIGGLRVQDLDLDNGDPTIHVRQAVSLDGVGQLKTPSSRAKLHIGRWLAAELRHHIETFGTSDDGRLFTTDGRDGALDSTRFNARVKEASARAGVPGVRAHMLRHFCASLLIQAGANPKQVSHHMRHASIEMTLDRYAELWPSDLTAIGLKVDELLAGHALPAHEPKALPAVKVMT